MDENITNMQFQEQEVHSKQTKISAKYYPGFTCFFKSYLQNHSINFAQCIQPMLHSYQKISSIKNPLQNLIKNQNKAVKQDELIKRSYENIFHMHYYKDQSKNLYPLKIYSHEKQEKQIQNLENKLKSLRQEKQRLIVEKKDYFRKQRQKQLQRQRIQQERRKLQAIQLQKKKIQQLQKK